jgi:hypothetical protein
MGNISPLRILGTEVPVSVYGSGRFYAMWKENQYEGDSISELKEKLTAAAKRDRLVISVPFMMIRDGELVAGVATGVHARDGRILAVVDGEKDQLRGYNVDALKPLDELTEAELRLALSARKSAQDTIDRIQKDHRLPLKQTVEDALGSAVEA